SGFINSSDFTGKNIHFGVREHAMAAIANGIAYAGILKPFIGTFLVFSDYMRPSIRLAALAKLPVIYVFTHDSFYVGEDGPTHHPVEHISSLRLIPDLIVIRPADGEEVKQAWLLALQSKQPVALCLTRQNVSPIERSNECQLEKGAYIVRDAKNDPELIIIATGSELSLVMETVDSLENNLQIRIISMASSTLYDQQNLAYKKQLIPEQCVKRVFVEAGTSDLHYKYIGEHGLSIGMNRFSKSAPYQDLEIDFGFTKEALKQQLINYLNT
ncbi:MAG: transketolase, partial [Calditrichaeota bacterium]|nr:transketolase [Calditrichota bacterium]